MIAIHRTIGFKALFAIVAFTLLAAQPVRAANLILDDSIAGEITVAHDPWWEFGVISNGVAFPGHVPGSTTAIGENASFTGTWWAVTAGSPDPGAGVVHIVDPANPGLVIALIMANWSTEPHAGATDIATIWVNVHSTGCGSNLGSLRPQFTGQVAPPGVDLEISGLFADPGTGAPVSIPSNLTIQYRAGGDLNDTDCDGVPNGEDACPDTALPEATVPSLLLGVNRFADIDGDGAFDTTAPKGKGPRKSFTLADTAGCSCEQIIAEQDLGRGHEKYGCSISAMEEWVDSLSP